MINKLRFKQHYVLFSRFLNKYLAREKCEALIFGDRSHVCTMYIGMYVRVITGEKEHTDMIITDISNIVPSIPKSSSPMIFLQCLRLLKARALCSINMSVTTNQHGITTQNLESVK
jgi:hypothetical protein